MIVHWKKIDNVGKYVLETLSREADDIPKEKLQSKWLEDEINLDDIKADKRMLEQHDLEDLHIKRRDDFLISIKMGKSILPLIVLGKELFLVDGYARYRALKKLGINRVKVFRQYLSK